ncbi:hypothetical protein [Luteolibacter sp. LG18]|uniref:hypothetical protein n=1 Tax=Luteolibacter sp. LG18 TaxID=2819286 RepID=UPI002B2814CE|nr:hypothetical protein llg_45450 [Luteolibacter sp. LG18]
MSSGLYNIVMFLPSLLVLAAQWIGLLSMGTFKKGGWRLMVAGTLLSTLAAVISIGFFLMRGAGAYTLAVKAMTIQPVGHILGGVLFAAGFIWHAFAVRSANEHLQQLETLTTAMAEELRVLRDGAK